MATYQQDDYTAAAAVEDVAAYHPSSSSWQRQNQSPSDEREEPLYNNEKDQQPPNVVVSPSTASSSPSPSPPSSFASSPSGSTSFSDFDDGSDFYNYRNEHDDNVHGHLQSSHYSASKQMLTFEELERRFQQVYPSSSSSISSWSASKPRIRRTAIVVVFLFLLLLAFMAAIKTCETKLFPSKFPIPPTLSSLYDSVSDIIKGEIRTYPSASPSLEESSVCMLDSDKVCHQSEVMKSNAGMEGSGDADEINVVERHYPIFLTMVRTVLTDALVGYRHPSDLNKSLKRSVSRSSHGQAPHRDDPGKKMNKRSTKKKTTKNVREEFTAAYGQELVVTTDHQRQLLQRLADDLINDVDDATSETTGFMHRSSLVPWGGPSTSTSTSTSTSDAESYEWFSSQENGRNLLYGYLRLMKWPADLRTGICRNHLQQQLRLSRDDGGTCDANNAIYHSLTFRESYKPWIVTKSMMVSNSHGAMYHHGFSPSLRDIMNFHRYEGVRDGSQHLQRSEIDNGGISWSTLGHSLVWIRPALRIHVDDKSTVRAAINILDRAVAASLQRSGGRVGKFNVVFDMKGLSWQSTPSMTCIKSTLTVLNNHYIDRLGIVLLVNMSHVSEVLLNLVRPLLSPEVRNKIVIVPSRDKKHREEVLSSVLGSHNIPTWLGGIDTYKFNLTNYYGDQSRVWDSDEKGFDGKALQQ